MKTKMFKRITASLLSFLLMVSIFTVGVNAEYLDTSKKPEETQELSWEEKIDEKLWEKIELASEDEKIPVWLWYKDINQNEVDAIVKQKSGLTANNIDVGIEMPSDSLISSLKEENKESTRKMQEYLDRTEKSRALEAEKTDTYVMTRREVSNGKYSEKSTAIKSKIELDEKNIIYSSRYSPMIIAEMTKEEILKASDNPEIESIRYYEEPKYTECTYDSIVSGSSLDKVYNNLGLTGENVKVGLFDTGTADKNDITCPELWGVNNLHLANPDIGYTNHATTRAIVFIGKEVAGSTSRGLSPGVELWSTSAGHDIYGNPYTTEESFEDLLDLGVQIVNISINFGATEGYTNYHNTYFDHIVFQHNVSIFASAGNNGALPTSGVASPSNSYNVISVGGANTDNDTWWDRSNGQQIAGGASDFRDINGVAKPDAIMWLNMTGGGTSTASPVLAAITALCLELKPSLAASPEIIKAIIMASCHRKLTIQNASLQNQETMEQGITDKQGAGLPDAWTMMCIISQGTYGNGILNSASTNININQAKLDSTKMNVSLTWLKGNDRTTNNNSNPGTTNLIANLGMNVYRGNTLIGTSNLPNSSTEMCYVDLSPNEDNYRVNIYNSTTENARYGYAWCANTTSHTVTLNANGGTGGATSVIAAYGSAMPTATMPTRSGYTFMGYYDTSAATGGTQYYTASGASARTWNKTTDATLYARWQATPYTVTLNANGGTGGTTSVTATYGSTMPTATMPTRSGYTFVGYYDTSASTGGTQYYIASGTSARTWNKTAAATLYARWSAGSYTVTYNANGGSNAPASQTKLTNVPLQLTTSTPGTPKSYTLTFNANGGNVSQTSKSVSCTFKNWNSNSGGTGTTYSSGGSYTANANLTLYAQWNNPVAGTMPTPTQTGYEFLGWYGISSDLGLITSSSTVTSSQTLYAMWTSAKYTVTLNANSGTGGTTSVTATYGSAMPSATMPTRLGYTFVGYYDTSAATGGTQYYTATGASAKTWNKASAITLYARWQANPYTITYNANGGSNAPASQTKAHNIAFQLTTSTPGTPKSYTLTFDANGGSVSQTSKSLACTFKNWNSIAGGTGDVYVSGSYYFGNANLTLYAQWNNPAAGTMPTPTRTGYSFAGWCMSPFGDGPVSSTTVITINRTLYAKWSAVPYTVTLNANGGSGGTSSVTATYGNAMPTATMPTRTGYTFEGYYDTSAATGGTQYYTNIGASARTWNKTAATTLYARWTLKKSEVALNRNGGTGGTSRVTATYSYAMPSMTKPTRTDYAFCGYYDNTSGGTQYYTSSGASARVWNKTADATLYARWRKLGDVNNDNAVDMEDVLRVQRHVAALITLTGDDFLAADVNRDGKVDLSDVLLIQNYVAKLITSFDNISKSTALYIDFDYMQQNFPTEFALFTAIDDINGKVTITDLHMVEQYMEGEIALSSLSSYYSKSFSSLDTFSFIDSLSPAE